MAGAWRLFFCWSLARGTFLLCPRRIRILSIPAITARSFGSVRRVHRPADRSSGRVPNRAIFATLSRKRFLLRMLEGEGTATRP